MDPELSQFLWFFLKIGGAVILFLGLFVFVVVKRGFDFKKLCARGVSTIGTVRSLHTGGPQASRMIYTFTAPDGTTVKRSALLSSGERESLREGGPVEIVYLPDNPKCCAPGWLIARSRAALAKKDALTSPRPAPGPLPGSSDPPAPPPPPR